MLVDDSLVTDEFVYCFDATCLGTLTAVAVDKHDITYRVYQKFAMICCRDGIAMKMSSKK